MRYTTPGVEPDGSRLPEPTNVFYEELLRLMVEVDGVQRSARSFHTTRFAIVIAII